MYVHTIRPMPKAVPRLVRAGNWYFLKKPLKYWSSARERMAGLSDRNVVTTPRDAAPGRLYRGTISGLSSRLARDTTPNSENRADTAPISTQIAVRYSTVSMSRE